MKRATFIAGLVFLMPLVASAATLSGGEQDQLQTLLSKFTATPSYPTYAAGTSSPISTQILEAVNRETVVASGIIYYNTSTTSSSSEATTTLQAVSEDVAMSALISKIALLKQILANLIATSAYKSTNAATSTAASRASETPSVECPIVTRKLRYGISGDDVIALQRYFITQGLMPVGSDVGLFGTLTESALKQWQVRELIISDDMPDKSGWGMTGPKTRAALATCTVSHAADVSAATTTVQ